MGNAPHSVWPLAANPFPLATWANDEQNAIQAPHEELK